jgi:two-component system OmpR family sensor kinase
LVIALAHHEKSAFYKFFFTYFISVALLIVTAGFFYFKQMESQLMKGEHFSLIRYARHIKMGENLEEFTHDYHYRIIPKKKHIDIQNFAQKDGEFFKFIPTHNPQIYMQVFKTTQPFEQKLTDLKYKIIAMQVVLLALFALLSYFLARNALHPLNESINTLDRFVKDLIHDLNTPVTAMKLNLKLLERQTSLSELKPWKRLEQSVTTISELHTSLTTLLESKTFQIKPLNVCALVEEVIELHQPNYPDLVFIFENCKLEVLANENGLKQILHNLISNACKYNTQGGYVKIFSKGKTLFIEDSGVGIHSVEKIFDREYSAHNSTGLGLDIVKRLCEAMSIKVDVVSSEKGSCFALRFDHSDLLDSE